MTKLFGPSLALSAFLSLVSTSAQGQLRSEPLQLEPYFQLELNQKNQEHRRMNHCDHTTDALCRPIPINSPANGDTFLITDDLETDQSGVYIMTANAGCSYLFTFCEAGGMSSSTGGSDAGDYPYIQLKSTEATDFPFPDLLPFCFEGSLACEEGSGEMYFSDVDQDIIISVDTFFGDAVSYTLAIVASGPSCTANPPPPSCYGNPECTLFCQDTPPPTPSPTPSPTDSPTPDVGPEVELCEDVTTTCPIYASSSSKYPMGTGIPICVPRTGEGKYGKPYFETVCVDPAQLEDTEEVLEEEIMYGFYSKGKGKGKGSSSYKGKGYYKGKGSSSYKGKGYYKGKSSSSYKGKGYYKGKGKGDSSYSMSYKGMSMSKGKSSSMTPISYDDYTCGCCEAVLDAELPDYCLTPYPTPAPSPAPVYSKGKGVPVYSKGKGAPVYSKGKGKGMRHMMMSYKGGMYSSSSSKGSYSIPFKGYTRD